MTQGESRNGERQCWKDIPGRPRPTWVTANPKCMTDCRPMDCSCLKNALAEWQRDGESSEQPYETSIPYRGNASDLATDIHAMLNEQDRRKFAEKWAEREGEARSERRDTPSEAAIDAALAFLHKSRYLSHPDVREWRGTANGDTEEAWNRDYVAALLRAALAANHDGAKP